MRIFLTKPAARTAKRENISDSVLREAIERAERGLIDADLGGGLVKLRVARPGAGRSGGFRTIVAYRTRGRAVFLFIFAKKDLGNISDAQQNELRSIGRNWLNLPETELDGEIESGIIREITP